MEAGGDRKLDLLIHSDIMGRKILPIDHDITSMHCDCYPRYSTDPAAAWRVVEKLRSMEDGEGNPLLCCLDVYSDYDYFWEIRWSYSELSKYNDAHKEHYTGGFDEFPEAICKAALLIKPKGVKHE